MKPSATSAVIVVMLALAGCGGSSNATSSNSQSTVRAQQQAEQAKRAAAEAKRKAQAAKLNRNPWKGVSPATRREIEKLKREEREFAAHPKYNCEHPSVKEPCEGKALEERKPKAKVA